MVTRRIAAVLLTFVLSGGALILFGSGSPLPAATAFVGALPTGRATLERVAPALMRNAGFRQYLSGWLRSEASTGWHKREGPMFAQVVNGGTVGARVDVVSHYVEVAKNGRTVPWEQDFALTLNRSLSGWQIVSARTTAIAIVSPLGEYSPDGPTAMIVPPRIYIGVR